MTQLNWPVISSVDELNLLSLHEILYPFGGLSLSCKLLRLAGSHGHLNDRRPCCLFRFLAACQALEKAECLHY